MRVHGVADQILVVQHPHGGGRQLNRSVVPMYVPDQVGKAWDGDSQAVHLVGEAPILCAERLELLVDEFTPRPKLRH